MGRNGVCAGGAVQHERAFDCQEGDAAGIPLNGVGAVAGKGGGEDGVIDNVAWCGGVARSSKGAAVGAVGRSCVERGLVRSVESGSFREDVPVGSDGHVALHGQVHLVEAVRRGVADVDCAHGRAALYGQVAVQHERGVGAEHPLAAANDVFRCSRVRDVECPAVEQDAAGGSLRRERRRTGDGREAVRKRKRRAFGNAQHAVRAEDDFVERPRLARDDGRRALFRTISRPFASEVVRITTVPAPPWWAYSELPSAWTFARGNAISAASVRRIEMRPPAEALPPLLPPVELPSAEMVPEPESEAVLR